GLLAPHGPGPREYEGRAIFVARTKVLVAAVYPRGLAVVLFLAYGDRVAIARDRDRVAELPVLKCVRRLEIHLLTPRRAGPREHVGSAGVRLRVIGLVTAHAGRTARLERRAHDERVAVVRQLDLGPAPTIVSGTAEVIAGAGVRCLDICLLAPGRARACEH